MTRFKQTLALIPCLALVACGSSGDDSDDDNGVDVVESDVGEDTSEVDVAPDVAEDVQADVNVPDVPEVTGELEWVCTTNVTATAPWESQGLDGDRFEATFELPENAYSFFLGAYEPGYVSVFEGITMPDGTYQSFLDGDYFMFHTSLYFNGGELDSLLIPPAPDYGFMVQEGTYTLEGLSTFQDFCFYVLVNEEPGTNIDVNFYFVDIPGLDAASAPDNADFGAVVGEFAETFADSGVTLNVATAGYFDVDDAAAEAHTIIRGQNQVSELVSESLDRGIELPGALAMNIFMIQGFAGNLEGVLGISPGIPGAAGLHGGPASGVVFATEGLLGEGNAWFDGNTLLGQTMAHEVGHYLGLFHTTETDGETSDPLSDTPVCPASDIQDYRRMQQCPDFDNLMFPTASLRDQAFMSGQQAETLQGNPIVQP